MEEARQGELEELWRSLAGPLRAFVARRVATPEDADDIVSDVFLRVQLKMDGVRDDERLVGWIYRITRNAIIDHYRAAPRRREVLAAALPEAAASGAVETLSDDDVGTATRRELVACLRPAIAALPPAAREALELTELGDLTQAEAAARAGISVSGMKSRVQRARHRVRALIEECCQLAFDGRGTPIARSCTTACCAA